MNPIEKSIKRLFMSTVVSFHTDRNQAAQFALNLPGPRIWTPQHLAKFLGVSMSWIYKRTQEKAEDPIPRVPGVGILRFDTQSPRFRIWMQRQLGFIDSEVGDE
jgi:hypothetical protein